MRKLTLIAAMVFAYSLLSGPALLQQKGGEDETGPYEVVADWPKMLASAGHALGSQGGVFAESPNRVFLLNRGEIKLPEKLPNNFNGAWGSIGSALTPTPVMRNCIIIVDANGKMIESWTQWDRLFQGGESAAKYFDAQVTPIRCPTDDALQSQKIRDLVAQGIDGIIVSPVKPEAQTPLTSASIKIKPSGRSEASWLPPPLSPAAAPSWRSPRRLS